MLRLATALRLRGSASAAAAPVRRAAPLPARPPRRAASSSSSSSSAAASPHVSPAPAPTRAEVLRAMNERLLLVRRLERSGLRRCLMACGAFLVFKVLRARVFGGGAGGAPGAGGGSGGGAAPALADR